MGKWHRYPVIIIMRGVGARPRNTLPSLMWGPNFPISNWFHNNFRPQARKKQKRWWFYPATLARQWPTSHRRRRIFTDGSSSIHSTIGSSLCISSARPRDWDSQLWLSPSILRYRDSMKANSTATRILNKMPRSGEHVKITSNQICDDSIRSIIYSFHYNTFKHKMVYSLCQQIIHC